MRNAKHSNKEQDKKQLIFVAAIIAVILISGFWVSYTIKTLNECNQELETKLNAEQLNSKNLEQENSELQERLNSLTTQNQELEQRNRELIKSSRSNVTTASRSSVNKVFTISCYDLSVQSCGKSMSNPGYGVTASGESLAGKNWQTARSVAAHKNLFPLGTKIKIEFLSDAYKKYDGVYTVNDRCGRTDRIDLFLGDFNSEAPSPECKKFGLAKAKVTVL